MDARGNKLSEIESKYVEYLKRLVTDNKLPLVKDFLSDHYDRMMKVIKTKTDDDELQKRMIDELQYLLDEYSQETLTIKLHSYAIFHCLFNPNNQVRSDGAAFIGLPSQGDYVNYWTVLYLPLSFIKNCYKLIVEFLPLVARESVKLEIARKLFLFVSDVSRFVTSPWRSAKEWYQHDNNLVWGALSLGISALLISFTFILFSPLFAPLFSSLIATSFFAEIYAWLVPIVKMALIPIAHMGIESVVGYSLSSDIVFNAGVAGIFYAFVILPLGAALKYFGKLLLESFDIKDESESISQLLHTAFSPSSPSNTVIDDKLRSAPTPLQLESQALPQEPQKSPQATKNLQFHVTGSAVAAQSGNGQQRPLKSILKNGGLLSPTNRAVQDALNGLEDDVAQEGDAKLSSALGKASVERQSLVPQRR